MHRFCIQKSLNKKNLTKSHTTIHMMFYDIHLILWRSNFANNLCISPKEGYLTYDKIIKIGPTNMLRCINSSELSSNSFFSINFKENSNLYSPLQSNLKHLILQFSFFLKRIFENKKFV